MLSKHSWLMICLSHPRPTLASPPILPAEREREITREQTAPEKKEEKKNITQKGREESTRGTSSASAQRKTFLLSPFLLRLFCQTAPQMLVQTRSNSPTDHVGCICTCVTQAIEDGTPPPLPNSFHPETRRCVDLKARLVSHWHNKESNVNSFM